MAHRILVIPITLSDHQGHLSRSFINWKSVIFRAAVQQLIRFRLTVTNRVARSRCDS